MTISAKGRRVKGDKFERLVVEILSDAGVPAQRVPLSGAAGGMFGGDVQAITRVGQVKLECKIRADKWVEEYRWLVGNYALVIKRDREEPLVLMRLSDFKTLARPEPPEPWSE